NRCLISGNGGGGLHHLVVVVHDPHGAVFRKHHQIHPRQPDLHTLDHVRNLAGVVQHLGFGMQPWHLVVHHRHADGIVTAGNITVSHTSYSKVLCRLSLKFGPMGRGPPSETVCARDGASEPTGTYSRRVSEGCPRLSGLHQTP